MSIRSIKKQMRAHHVSMATRLARFAALAALGALTLAGCSGGSTTEPNPIPPGSAMPDSNYSGPGAADDEIRAFQNGFWTNIRGTDRCGGCHNATGQAPSFARSDDVNQAYQQAIGIVNRENPSLSALVTKVAGGHNCWRGDTGACTADLITWINAWVGAEDTSGKQIQLIEPQPIEPGASKRFPALPPAAFKPVYDLLDQYCSSCHQPNSATAQSPFFAAGDRNDPNILTSDEYLEAYHASQAKINLNEPALSRFVVRLGKESHNCWTDCSANAAALLARIQALANAIPVDPTPPGTLSKALTLYDGTIASGGSRYERNIVALYEFKTGSGNIAYDTSGVAPAADLELTMPSAAGPGIEWVGGYGINIRSGRAKTFGAPSRKFYDKISATGEYTVEAWVVPGNVTQEDARIVSYSGSATTRNFTLGQQLYNYEFAGRSSATNADGAPRLSTDPDKEVLQSSLQHVVLTFDPVNGRRIYVNGQFTGDVDRSGGGTLEAWDNSFALFLGNEASGNRQWQGVVRLAAVYSRALTLQQINQNFEAGVGQKFFLLFGVSHIINVPQAYILFEATQYDSYGYLFTNPKFISLDETATPGSIRLKGMRIGVNGAESQVGQAYRLLDMNISSEMYSAATGQLLSSVGTIIPVEQGPEADQFFLCFDALGTETNACTQYAVGVAPTPVLAEASSDIGVKLFDAINATMSTITGVPQNNAKVKATYASVRQSLPAVNDIQGYLSSHQTSLAQLALQYCNVMMDTPSLRDVFFSGINYSSPLTEADYSAVNANGQAVIDQLHSKMIGASISQPNLTEFRTDMGDLMESLCNPNLPTVVIAPATRNRACGTVNPQTNVNRTVEVIKAACGAALGNAATLVQ
ncbi:LamG domain-containing protein [Steroidobacter cummioxidans]|uniref:LamG domain-containing protein n=1 Tax=Steroidobacter cummioxidans TaxID=1803913 RepID=UPI00137B83BB|nr:LamG domain-containing protein [Steroidobacter cummioxidans]